MIKILILPWLLLLVQCSDKPANFNNEENSNSDSINEQIRNPRYLSGEWIGFKKDSLLINNSECEEIYLGQNAYGLAKLSATQFDVLHKGSQEIIMQEAIDRLSLNETNVKIFKVLASAYDSSSFVVALRTLDVDRIQDSLGKINDLGYTHLVFIDSIFNSGYSIIDIRGFPYSGWYYKPTVATGNYTWSYPYNLKDSLRIFLQNDSYKEPSRFFITDTLYSVLIDSLDSNIIKNVIKQRGDEFTEFWFYSAAQFNIITPIDHVLGYYAGYSDFRWLCKTHGSSLLHDMERMLMSDMMPINSNRVVILDSIDSEGSIHTSTYDNSRN